MITIFDKKWCTLTIDLESKILTETWRGFISDEQFKECIDIVVDCFHTYDLAAILVNAKEVKLLSEENKEYAASRIPERKKKGLKYIAFVMPLNETACIAINEFTAMLESNMIKHFETKEAAWEWLEEQSAVTD